MGFKGEKRTDGTLKKVKSQPESHLKEEPNRDREKKEHQMGSPNMHFLIEVSRCLRPL